MESWRKVWRKGFVPQFSNEELVVLRDGLMADDPNLLQGVTTDPPPLGCIWDWPCKAACAVSYCGWRGRNLQEVGEVEEFFSAKCFRADKLLDEPAGCRWFLNWFDETPRSEMRRLLLEELTLNLVDRGLTGVEVRDVG